MLRNDPKTPSELPASDGEIIPFKTPDKDEIDLRNCKGTSILKIKDMNRLFDCLNRKPLADAITAISQFVPKKGSIADLEFVFILRSYEAFEMKRIDPLYLSSPLHLAAGRASCELVGILTRMNADVNRQSQNGDTPLHSLCKADPFYPGNYKTERDRASSKQVIRCLETLLNLGARLNYLKYPGIRVDEYNRHRATPLYGAARRGRLDVVKLLLENGANPNLRTVVRIDLPPKSSTYPDLSAAIRIAGSTALIDGNSPIDVANRRHKTECRKLMEEHSEKHNEQLSLRAYPSVSESEPEA